MSHINRKQQRILAIWPNTRGYGFAVLDGETTLVDWGIKGVKGDKNARCLEMLDKQMSFFSPDVIVLQDFAAKGSRRCARIRALGEEIIAKAKSRRLKVSSFSNEGIMKTFSEDGKTTKETRAEAIAGLFPEKLAHRLPPKRKLWKSEDYNMGIFDAVALAISYFQKGSRRVYNR